MKKKITVILSVLALAITAAVFFNASPAQAGINPLPAPVGCSERFCGSHRHHHCHYWYCGDREFWCPGHDD